MLWYAEKWSPKKCPSKILLRQSNAKKFKRFFSFLSIDCTTHKKDVWRLRHDSTYAQNCRKLKESRKICYRVLGFHRLIKSEHSTHTHTHDARRPTPRFFVSDEFPGDHFSRDQFSGDHFSRWPFFRGPFFRVPFFPGATFFRDSMLSEACAGL